MTRKNWTNLKNLTDSSSRIESLFSHPLPHGGWLFTFPGGALELPAIAGQALELPAIAGQALELPAIAGQALELPAIASQALELPAIASDRQFSRPHIDP